MKEHNKKKILYIAKNIPVPTRKANRVIFTLAENLSDQCNIDFLYPKEIVPFFAKNIEKYKHLANLQPWDYGSFRVNILNYFRLPIPGIAMALTPFFLKRPDRIRKYHFIHAHYVLPDGYIAYLMHKEFGIPFGITIRKTDIELISKIRKNSHTYKLMRKVLQEARFSTCLNSAVQQSVKRHFDVLPTVVPHGIEKEFLIDETPVYALGHIKISCVGDFIPTKQIDWLIKAFKKIKTDDKISLTVIGDGPEENHLKTLAANHKNIHFTGRIPKKSVIQHLTHSQIFALPSNSETYGLVYNEAAARHNAMIGFKGQGPCGTYNVQTEMLFSESFEDFCNKLNFLVNDRISRQEIANNALNKVKEITWDKISDRYNALYSNPIINANKL